MRRIKTNMDRGRSCVANANLLRSQKVAEALVHHSASFSPTAPCSCSDCGGMDSFWLANYFSILRATSAPHDTNHHYSQAVAFNALRRFSLNEFLAKRPWTVHLLSTCLPTKTSVSWPLPLAWIFAQIPNDVWTSTFIYINGYHLITDQGLPAPTGGN